MKKWIWTALVLWAGFSAMAEVPLNPVEETWERADSVIVVLKEALPEMPVGALADGQEAPSLFSSIGSLKKVMRKPVDSLSAPLSEGATAPEMSQAARNVNNMYSADLAQGMSVDDALIELRASSLVEYAALLELRASSLVEYAEPNYIVHTLTLPTDPFFNEVWASDNHGQEYYNRSLEIVSGTAGADMNWTSAWPPTR